ncbi:MAG: zinc ribbon domain-containing protein, partial [Planctomycetaceae bacterium]|nr:zinc ribbon domain-containing protein [Planctomycetaceae bacterium]
MPIKFRCQHCRQFLGISRSKAGAITDCPTCGRTIRVPQLDGHVDDLPAPQMDFEDAHLREALGALASLGDAGAAEQPLSKERDAGPPHVAPLPSAHSPKAAPAIPFMEPEIIELDAGSPIPVEAHSHTVEPDVPFAVVEEDPLAQLARESSTTKDLPPRRQSSFRVGPLPLLIVALLSVVSGWLIGRNSSISNPSAVGSVDAVEDKQDGGVANPAEPENWTVTGTVRFAEVTGQTLPDRGARILILPKERKGTLLLPHQGIRPGSDPVDTAALEAAIQELGGQLVTADDQGDFTVKLDGDTIYGLLIISRYQAREGAPVLNNKLQQLLGS